MRKSVVVVGSVNLDLVAGVDRIPAPGETILGNSFQTFFGGKGANQAVSVARLQYPVSMVAKVGDDDIGERLRRGLREAGVNTKAVGTAPHTSSGVAPIATDKHGHNSIIVVPGANAKLMPADINKLKSLIESAGMILLQLEIPLETVARTIEMAQKKNVPVMLDPAPARELPPGLLAHVTWLTPNETEACMLCQGKQSGAPDVSTIRQYAERLLEKGARNVVIKLGSRGAYLASKNGDREYIPAFAVRCVDSTAAGDAFNGGLAVALMQGRGTLEALRFATAVAGLSVTKAGAQPSMPTLREARRMLKQGSVQESP